MVPDLVERRMPLRDEIAGRRALAENAPREPVGRMAGAVRLDVTASRACALARFAVLDEHRVAELGPAVEELAVDHDAAADTGSERQHHQIRAAASGAVRELRERGGVRVVLDPDGDPEPLRELVAEAHLAQRDVDGAEHDACPLVDARRDAEADGADLGGQELANRRLERVEERVLRCRRRGALAGPLHASVLVDHARENLRPAQVDADHALSRHDGWVPYFAGWPRKGSPI